MILMDLYALKRPSELGATRVEGIIKFPDGSGFLFNYVWGKTLRLGVGPYVDFAKFFKKFGSKFWTRISKKYLRNLGEFGEISKNSRKVEKKYARNRWLGREICPSLFKSFAPMDTSRLRPTLLVDRLLFFLKFPSS